MKLFELAILLFLKFSVGSSAGGPGGGGGSNKGPCGSGPDQICSDGYCYKVKGSTASRCPPGYSLVKDNACTCAGSCPSSCQNSPCSSSNSFLYVQKIFTLTRR